jgi:hypothetical protein
VSAVVVRQSSGDARFHVGMLAAAVVAELHSLEPMQYLTRRQERLQEVLLTRSTRLSLLAPLKKVETGSLVALTQQCQRVWKVRPATLLMNVQGWTVVADSPIEQARMLPSQVYCSTVGTTWNNVDEGVARRPVRCNTWA